MIVVTAPTGNIGHHVVQRLLDGSEPLRVVARDPSKLPVAVRERAQVVKGSHGDAAVIDRALEGADALFWLVPPDASLTLDEAYPDFTRPAAEAIRRRGVGHVVSVTALGRGTPWQDKAGLVTASIRMDDILMQTGAAFRGLAMPSFMENALQQVPSIKGQGTMMGPLDADLKAPTTATRDMGAAAARLLADRSWSGQEEVPVLGPEDLSMNDIAAIVSQVAGRQVGYRQVPLEAFGERLAGFGMSPSFVAGYVDMMRAKNEGMDNQAARAATTRTATTYRQWAEQALKPALAG